MNFIARMMPGSEPYTVEETELVQSLIVGACDAEARLDLDELEQYAAQMAFAARRGEP